MHSDFKSESKTASRVFAVQLAATIFTSSFLAMHKKGVLLCARLEKQDKLARYSHKLQTLEDRRPSKVNCTKQEGFEKTAEKVICLLVVPRSMPITRGAGGMMPSQAPEIAPWSVPNYVFCFVSPCR